MWVGWRRSGPGLAPPGNKKPGALARFV